MIHNLIILGGNVEAVPIIERAIALGHRAVVVDGDARCPGRSLTDDFVHASCYHGDRAIPALSAHAYNARLSYDGVLCAAIDAPITAAEIAHAFGLPGLSVEAARLSSDKYRQKEWLNSANIPLPRFQRAFNGMAITVAKMLWQGPVVVKPVDSRGGRGVIRCADGVGPDFAWQIAHDNSPTGNVIVEQWLDGPQLSTESIVQDGRVLFTAAGLRNYERLEEFAPFVIEDGFDEPWLPAPGDNIIEKCGDVIVQACRALDWYQRGAGTVKGDLVIHDECVHVIELAARLSGGFFSTHGVPQTTGVDLVGAAIRAALGETLKPIEPVPLRFVSQRYVFPEPQDIGKTVVAIDNHRPESAIFHSWNIHEDAVVQPVTSHPARWGQCIAVGATSGEARRRAGQGVREMKAGVVLK